MSSNAPLPDYTPEEKARILAKFKAEFSALDLMGYLVDEDEKYPATQVLTELKEIVRKADANDLPEV